MSTPKRLAVQPSWLASQVALYADRLVREALDRSGARKHHYAVLVTLAETAAISQAELGRRLWIDRSDLHTVLNELERDGFVARVRDEADRRRKLVDLTPAGTAKLRELDRRVASAQDVLLEALTPAERRELGRLLTTIVEHQTPRRSAR